MAIKRFIANADTTITDAFEPSLKKRANNANMGGSDSLEIFSLYGQDGNGSIEKSRILIQFPIDQIKQERDAGKIPVSGSVRYILKLSNVKHPQTLPRNFSVDILTVSGSWDEGEGLDMETYRDYGWGDE